MFNKFILIILEVISLTVTNIENKVYTEQKAKEAQLQEITEPQLKSLGTFKLTAYCSCEKCCGKWALNRPKDEQGNDIVIGASGEQLQQNFSVAVDPKYIPYGTYLNINGTKYRADDCGGAIKNNRIDIYFNNHQDALEFGVQYNEVFIYE